MITIRMAEERGHANHGWLDSHHTFSFADYHDPRHVGFRSLRVINDDRVAPGQGFGTHSHRDMEIISYVLEGALEHRDSLGTGSIIVPGDVQRMSAGTGVAHSEFNASKTEPVHFLQIWIYPTAPGMKPSYQQKTFSREERQGKLRVVASPAGRDGSVLINSDATVYAGLLDKGQDADLPLSADRYAWVHVARGKVRVNGKDLKEGDGASLSGETRLRLEGVDSSEVLIFDLA